MSLKKLLVSGAAALALVGTAASAAVSVECDGTGDYLIDPVYYAIGNWSTTIKVVNTNTTNAVVAKVVLREHKDCKEILDFPVYLTPGDVVEFTIFDDNGKVKVKTTDDSVIIGGKQASPSDPIVMTTTSTSDYNKDNGWMGYVEVFGLAMYDGSIADSATYTWGGECTPLDKMKFYNKVRQGSNLLSTGAKDVTNDTLLGKATIYAESSDVNGRRTMMLNMTALGDVATAPRTSGVIGTDTTIASMSNKPVTTVLGEIDRALAKSHIYVMYEGDGNELYPIRTHFTVPTKKYWHAEAPVLNSLAGNGEYSDLTPGDATDNGIPSTWAYTLDFSQVVFRDMEENCHKCTSGDLSPNPSCNYPIAEEIHIFQNTDSKAVPYDASLPIGKYAFTEGGYIDFDLTNISARAGFDGMPIIPTTFYAKKVQGIHLNNWLYNQYRVAPSK